MPESTPGNTGIFAPFEWMIAAALPARQAPGKLYFGDLGFSLVGIALGVATLIIVMSVMGGFRKEFLESILGFNGPCHGRGRRRAAAQLRRASPAAC